MILHAHDPNWAAEFARLRAVYAAVLGDLARGVEHVGSTAIRRIAAKPILDIDIVIASATDLPAVARKLASLGYRHNGDQGVPGREAFKRGDETVPHIDGEGAWMPHHLYVCVAGSRELSRHMRFRDRLNADPAAREEYEAIKRDIAARSHGDRKTYADLKENEGVCSAFIERVLDGP